MFQILLALYFLYSFWRTARSRGRNKFLWACIGVVSFLIPSYAVAFVIPRLLFYKVVSLAGTVIGYDSSIIAGIHIGSTLGVIAHFATVVISLVIGAFSALFVRRRFLEAKV
jgi:hypothetical protein